MTDADQDGAAGAQRGRAADSLSSESAARLADVCARRGAVYKALAVGFSEPTLRLVDALCDGRARRRTSRRGDGAG